MFKCFNKITPYLDESRLDLKLSKRSRNYRYKDKVIYLSDQTILLNYERNDKIWYKFNLKFVNSDFDIAILHRRYDKPSHISKCFGHIFKTWYCNGKKYRANGKPVYLEINCESGSVYKEWYKNGVQYAPFNIKKNER